MWYNLQDNHKTGGTAKVREKYTLDRIEGEVAVCVSFEDGRITEHSSAPLLAAGVKEGGIFSAETDGNGLFDIEYLDRETERAKENARKRLFGLFNRRKENEE